MSGITIESLRRTAPGGVYTSPARIFLTEDGGEVVFEGDARAATLLCGEGCEMPADEAAKYGLIADDGESPADAGASSSEGSTPTPDGGTDAPSEASGADETKRRGK